MEAIIINLQDYRTEGSKVFTGRDRGADVRVKSKIDDLELNNKLIEVHVPADIRSINPSFLEEFLNNVVTRLGSEGFNNKIKFIMKGRYNIQSDLDEAVDRILREENALA